MKVADKNRSLLGPRGADPQDPVGRIVDCHARIRKFAATAIRLHEAPATDAERAEAAAAVARYFSTSFVLHGRDEEEFLVPKLRGRGDAALQQAMDRLAPDHRRLDALLAVLIPAWNDLPRLAAVEATTREFVGLVEEHLALEESVVLPAAARLLTPDEKRAMVSDMIALRGR